MKRKLLFSAAFMAILLWGATTGNIQWIQIRSTDRHGTDAKGQSSDGTGTSGNLAKFNSGGGLTDGPALPLSVANGGSGTSTPSLVAGTNVTISGSWPNQTVTASGGGAGAAFCGTGTPSTVAGLYVWLDASQLTGLSDGDSVFSWTNQACGPAVSASYTTTPPVYKTNIVNGLPVVRFANDGFYAFICGQCVQSREVSIFLVLKMSSLSNAYTGIVTGFSGGFGWYVKSNGKTAFYTGGTNYDGTGAYTFGTTSFQVMSMVLAVPGVTTREALALDFTSSSQSFNIISTGPSVLLGNDTTASRILSGDIAEVLFYQRPLSTTDRNTIENYLKTKYAL